MPESDPLPFQWLAQESNLCRNVRFVDVDHKELIRTKKDIVQSTPQLESLLTSRPTAHTSELVLDAEEYVAIGCDLRDLVKLDSALRSAVSIQQCLVLCVAEVSITYMEPVAADALIAWAASLSSGERIAEIEQARVDAERIQRSRSVF